MKTEAVKEFVNSLLQAHWYNPIAEEWDWEFRQ